MYPASAGGTRDILSGFARRQSSDKYSRGARMQNRRAALALLCALAASHDALAAQLTYPAKPVRVLIGSPAGSTADVLARPIAQRLSEHLGVQFVIDNRSGATGQIANDIVVKAAPDGYTLLLIPGSQISIVPQDRK